MSFYLFIIPLVPAWVMMLYKYFYVFLSKLKKFGISKIKYGIFSAVVIALEIGRFAFHQGTVVYGI